MRTIVNTPRDKVIIYKVDPGEYIHFDVAACISRELERFVTIPLPNELDIDVSTDGCNLDKSGSNHLWPIQCRLANIGYSKPMVIGIYKGTGKPNDSNAFFEKFIADIKSILANGGITFHGKKLSIRLRCFIADAPARAFILNHRGHMSYHPCSKCKISGEICEGRYVFCGVKHALRTNEEYILCLDEDHHKDGKSPLSELSMGMVSQVPFEYMHNVCLGVVKKLLSAWINGKFSRSTKLSARCISQISARLEILEKYCPSDFARRPRSLDTYTKYKATECRQFLLYTGPVVTFDILGHEMYTHFLVLHAAIRILVSTSPTQKYLNFADLALQKFVNRCENLYGPTFNSYNVHSLLHLTNDVRLLGSLDSFSAFPYENNMAVFRKYCRKPGAVLQQIANRIAEIEAHAAMDFCIIDSSIHVSMRHNVGSLPCNVDCNCNQYRKIKFGEILLSLELRDNCCILRNGSICIVVNIFMADNSHYLVLKKFLNVDAFYDVGISSLALQIFKCSTLDDNIFSVHISEVRHKCYRMPFWNSTLIHDNDIDENVTEYIVAAIVHTEKI